MKMSTAIKKAISKCESPTADLKVCPVCHEMRQRLHLPPLQFATLDSINECKECTLCPVNMGVAKAILGATHVSRICGWWLLIAESSPESEEAIAAQEIILCLKAQGD